MFINMLNTAASFIFVISVLVFIHEFGHYIVARMFNVGVIRFSIGFGPKLFGFKDRNDTEWQISAIPLGGYVQMLGDMNVASAEEDEGLAHLSEEERQNAFPAQARWKKMWIVAAGPIANFLLAIVVLAGIFFFNPVPVVPPVIGEVVDNSPAKEAGLEPGDRILKVDGKQIQDFYSLKSTIAFYYSKELDFLIKRGDNKFNISITPKSLGDSHNRTQTGGYVGIAPDTDLVYYVDYGISGALVKSIKQNYELSRQTLISFGQMLLGMRGTDDLGGPVKIAQYSKTSASHGISSLLYFIAILSLNLGLINILPIPLLDGGHLFYYSIEALMGRNLNDNIKQIGYRIGAMIIFSLLIFSFYNDISNLL